MMFEYTNDHLPYPGFPDLLNRLNNTLFLMFIDPARLGLFRRTHGLRRFAISSFTMPDQ